MAETKSKTSKKKTLLGPFQYKGSTVLLWPRDTEPKEAVILMVDDLGFIFQITKSTDPHYPVGSTIFIGHGNHLVFRVID